MAAGGLAYHNSFSGPFIFDDTTSIPKNPNIRSLWPLWRTMTGPSQQTVDGRPVLCLSLAINYQISGLEVWSYHAANLAIHIAAAMLLFGVVRRTLLSDGLAGRFGGSSWTLALVCAVLWLDWWLLLHPVPLLPCQPQSSSLL